MARVRRLSEAVDNLEIFSEGSTDVVGTLYNSTGEEILADDNGGDANNFRISRSLAVGTYYLRVKGFNDSFSIDTRTGAYSLRIRRQ